MYKYGHKSNARVCLPVVPPQLIAFLFFQGCVRNGLFYKRYGHYANKISIWLVVVIVSRSLSSQCGDCKQCSVRFNYILFSVY